MDPKVAALIADVIKPSQIGAENHLNLLFEALEAVPTVIVVYDLEERFVCANSQAREYFRNYASVLVPGTTFEEVARYAAHSGEVVDAIGREDAWLAERLAQFRDPPPSFEQTLSDGRCIRCIDRKTPIGTVCIRVDISDLKRREKTTRDSEARYRTIAESALVGIVVARPDLRIIYANSAAAKTFGFDSPQSMLGESFGDRFAPRALAEDQARRERRMHGEPVPGYTEWEGRRVDGSACWIGQNANLVEWEGAPAIFGVFTDITERKRVEDALRESDERYRRLVEGALQGMAVVRLDQILFANQAEAAMFGFDTPDEFTRRGFQERVAPEDWERMLEFGGARLRGESPQDRYEFRGIRRDGGSVWIECFVSVVPWHDGPAIQMLHADITARNNAERALLESEARYKTLFEDSFLGNAVIVDGKITLANEAFARIFGFDLPGKLIGLPSFGLFAPEEGAILLERRNALLAGKHVAAREHAAIRADGEKIWVEAHPVPIVMGNKPATFLTVADISGRKKASEALRESELRLRNLIDSSVQGLLVHRNHKALFVNQALVNMFGYETADEVLALESTIPMLDPSEIPIAVQRRDKRMRGESALERYTFKGRRKDGSLVVIDSINAFILWDGEPAIMSTHYDISEISKSDEKRKQSDELIRFLVESINAIVYEFDITSKRFTYVSPQSLKMLGYEPEIWTDFDSLLTHVEPQHKNRVAREWLGLGQSGGKANLTYSVRDRNGNAIWIHDTHAPLAGLERSGVIQGVMLNVTQEMERERRLKESQKLETIGRLAAGVAHDFNNLLFIISGNIHLLLRVIKESQAQNDLQTILRATERGTSLVNRLLSYNRGRDGKREHVKMSLLLNESVSLASHLIPENIAVKLDLVGCDGAVWVDSTRIQQIILNLFTNARDAMPAGGEISVHCTKMTVTGENGDRFPHLKRGDYLLTEVADSGDGISDEDRGKIFAPFFTTKPPELGSGLGLAMSLESAKDHEGWLGVESAPGQGSRFLLYLPVSAVRP